MENEVFNDIKEMQNWCLDKKRQGQTIGLFPLWDICMPGIVFGEGSRTAL
jgi:hypothetical protein